VFEKKKNNKKKEKTEKKNGPSKTQNQIRADFNM